MVEDDVYGSTDRHDSIDRYGSDETYGHHRLERPRGWGCLAWFVILAVVGCLVYLRELSPHKAEKLNPMDDSPASMSGVMELQVRSRIGIGEFVRRHQPGGDADIRALFEGAAGNPADQANHAAMWGRGTFGQRLQYVILGGELAGPDEALKYLGKLKWDWEAAKLKPSAEQVAVFNSLRKVYQDYRKKKFDAPTVPDPERQLVLKKLGWYGRLALTPPDAPDQVARQQAMTSALRLFYGLLGIVGFILALGALGTIGLVIFALATATRGLKVGLREGSGSSGVYAETFALWLIGYSGGSYALQFWPWDRDRFLLNLILMAGSLLVLVWPVIRGIPWSEVCQDVGLTRGRAGWLEPLFGIAGYALMLPMLAVGFALTLAIMQSMANAAGAGPESPFEAQETLSHPIVRVVLQGGVWMQLQLVLLACVVAPIVEEILFRGLLYRQLRDATRGMGWLASCVVSAIWVSFIFAVIHPQGMVAVPALMGVACGCTLAREWRDSLWASMVVHAMNNGLIFFLLIVATS